MSTTQLSFDIDALIHQAAVDAAPSWDGAPLRYHDQYRTPAELDAAWERWQFENGSFGCIPYSHVWHRDSHRRGEEPSIGAHERAVFHADARCAGGRFGGPDHDHAAGEIPNELMYQIVCSPCRWHTINTTENAAVEAWHDHVLPGWRDLPVVPMKLAEHHSERKKLRRAPELAPGALPLPVAGTRLPDHHRAAQPRHSPRPRPLALGRIQPLRLCPRPRPRLTSATHASGPGRRNIPARATAVQTKQELSC